MRSLSQRGGQVDNAVRPPSSTSSSLLSTTATFLLSALRSPRSLSTLSHPLPPPLSGSAPRWPGPLILGGRRGGRDDEDAGDCSGCPLASPASLSLAEPRTAKVAHHDWLHHPGGDSGSAGGSPSTEVRQAVPDSGAVLK